MTATQEARYAALGRAAESNGLAWYGEDGQMLFQPPADMIEEQAKAELRVVGVAYRVRGMVFSMAAPMRHHNVLREMEDVFIGVRPFRIHPDDSGFLLNNGCFATRREAYHIAKAAGQLLPRQPGGYDGDELFSEDLW